MSGKTQKKFVVMKMHDCWGVLHGDEFAPFGHDTPQDEAYARAACADFQAGADQWAEYITWNVNDPDPI